MPAEGVDALPHAEILSYEEIARVVRIAASLGIHSIRLTGGEPLVRRGLCNLVREIRSIDGIDAVKITTNGVLLAEQLPDLLDAGLTGVNISLDTMKQNRFQEVSRRDELSRVLEGINAAIAASESPAGSSLSVKINCVPTRDFNEDELADIALFAKDHRVGVRFIELMPIGLGSTEKGLTQEEVMHLLAPVTGPLSEINREQEGSGPAVYFHPEGFQGNIGFISAMSHKFCDSCNRIRLTSDGILKPCLQYAGTTNIKHLLRSGCSDEELSRAISEVIFQKPKCHTFLDTTPDTTKETRKMSGIGG